MSILLDGTTGVTTPGVTDTGNLSVAGTAAITGATTLSTVLGVAQGGTGATSLTANNVLLGNGTSAVATVAPGTAGNILTSNGTTWTSSAAPANLTTIGPTTLSGTGTQSITGIPSTAKYVVVSLANITTTANDVSMKLINASGSTFSGTSYTGTGSTVTWASAALQDTYNLTSNTTGSPGGSGTFIFSLINSSTNQWSVMGTVGGYSTGGGSSASRFLTTFSGTITLTAAISGISFTTSSTMGGTATIQYI